MTASASGGVRDAAESIWRAEGRSPTEKGWAPLRYWVMWWVLLGIAVVLFYVVLTPVWIGLRAVAWLAEFRARGAARETIDAACLPQRESPASGGELEPA